MSQQQYRLALDKIAGLAEQRRQYDNKDELVVRMGDIANKALYNRRGPGTQIYCKGFTKDCKQCKLMGRACQFHEE